MADTYFEVRNGDNVFQFSDSTHLLHIAYEMEFVADNSQGEIYGIEIPKGIAGVSYWTRNATLFISPECTKNGKRYQYVASSAPFPIKAYFWSEDYFDEMEHGAGLELRDAKGNIVFNNKGYLGSFKKSFYSSITTYQSIISTDGETAHDGGVFYAPGFPMFYLALAVQFWGIYREYEIHIETGKHKIFWTEESRVSTLKGYSFGTAAGKPDNVGDFLAYQWDEGYEPHRWEYANKEMKMDTFFSHYIKKEVTRYYKEESIYSQMEWFAEHKNEEPDLVKREIIEDTSWGIYKNKDTNDTKIPKDISFKIEDSWDYRGTPSASLMSPMSIWMPPLVSSIDDINKCFCVGYDFYTLGDGYYISQNDYFTKISLKTLKGKGSLEHLRNVVQSQVEHKKNANGQDKSATWAVCDGIACDVSMSHIVDVV